MTKSKSKPKSLASKYPLRYAIRHSEEQFAAWNAAALAEDMPLQSWVRRVLNKAAAATEEDES